MSVSFDVILPAHVHLFSLTWKILMVPRHNTHAADHYRDVIDYIWIIQKAYTVSTL